MAVFENRSVLFELKTLPLKEKKKLRSAVTENGGRISYVVNEQCSLVVTGDVSDLSSSRLRGIQRHLTPVVGVDYVYGCLDRGAFLPVDGYRLETPPPPSARLPSLWRGSLSHPAPACQLPRGRAEPVDPVVPTRRAPETPESNGNVLEKFRIYTDTDPDLPLYPDHFEVAKYSIFEKANSTWCVLELQSVRAKTGRRYRVVRYWKRDVGAEKEAPRDELVFASTSEDALQVYQALRDTSPDAGLQLRTGVPPRAPDLGSAPLQQLLLEEKLNTGSVSREVGVFVELLWTEALGHLGVLQVPIEKLSLNDVSRAEGLLLQAQKKLREENHPEKESLLGEVFALIPHSLPSLPLDAKLISQTLDLCQLIRDVLSVSEVTLRSPAPSCLGKYRALRCSVEAVAPGSSDFQAAAALLRGDGRVQIQQVMRVGRGAELRAFGSEPGNVRPLLHSSSPSNFVGILSRGLLLPRVGVEHHGIERTDVGNLGSGIYFSDAIGTCLKYSRPSATDGSRLLLVCDVALGRCRDVCQRDVTLTEAPEGHHSVHGVRRTPAAHSDFEDDEYVVYRPDQVRLKYVVRFTVEGDQLKDFSPAVDTRAEPGPPPCDPELGVEDDGDEGVKDPLEDMAAGLLGSAGQQLPLQAVHVKCRLMDLLSQVVVFQEYTNSSSVPIEAKYVFPLDDSAAVCGFEAFIDGKHAVGKVVEKEQARREYRRAVERGHGAYLLDQDAPDVFTISVGNLPPRASVLIKLTFVSELIVRDGVVLFSLPGSVAPWRESAALNQTTQTTVEKVCVSDKAASTREFALDVSVEMPHEITCLQCTTHKVKMKRTDCKAVLSVLPGQVLGAEGFQLSITLSEVHLPRMWVEKHPDKDSQACMLVFYPRFDVGPGSASDEVVLLLDTSESMRGECLRSARRIALQVLTALGPHLRVNVVLFGTDHTEAFLTARPLDEARQAAESFIKRSPPVGGGTELWRPLRALSLLPPSRGTRNLLLLSDGHVQNGELALRLLRDNAEHSRLFSCGLSPTANRHMLRALAQAGGGAYEFFDAKHKHTWAGKVASQVKRMASPGCSSVSVKWQQFNPTAPAPVQAPKQLHALFNDCHALVYGFVPHCTQATLLGNLGGRELETVVSTSELQKTRGTFLHKLTARAHIRDYEDGNLDTDEAEHEGQKEELRSFIVELSKEFSILSQFTSFVAVEERDPERQAAGFTDVPELIAQEDVDFLPYVSWILPRDSGEEGEEEGETPSWCSAEDEVERFGALPEISDVEVERSFAEEDRSASFSADFASPSLDLDAVSWFAPQSPIRRFAAEEPEESYHCAGPLVLQSLFGGTAAPPPPPPTGFIPAAHTCAATDLMLPFPHPAKRKAFRLRSQEQRAGGGQRSPTFYPSSSAGAVSYDDSFRRAESHSMNAPQNCMGAAYLAPGAAPPPPPPPPPPSIFPDDSAEFESSRTLLRYRAASRSFSPCYGAIELMSSALASSDDGEERPGTSAPPPPPVQPAGKAFGVAFGAAPSPKLLPLCVQEEAAPAWSDAARLKRRKKASLFGQTSSFERASPGSRAQSRKWSDIFRMQHSEGFWEFTAQLGRLIGVDADLFANVFLESKGIRSLGARAHADILRLVATLLVLQLMRVEELEEGKLLRTLFCLDDPSEPRPERWEEVSRAVAWARRADRQHPCVYSRLEFGFSWESSTRQLLGYEGLPPFSPLRHLNLQLLVH